MSKMEKIYTVTFIQKQYKIYYFLHFITAIFKRGIFQWILRCDFLTCLLQRRLFFSIFCYFVLLAHMFNINDLYIKRNMYGSSSQSVNYWSQTVLIKNVQQGFFKVYPNKCCAQLILLYPFFYVYRALLMKKDGKKRDYASRKTPWDYHEDKIISVQFQVTVNILFLLCKS